MKKLFLISIVLLISLSTFAQRPVLLFGHGPQKYYSKVLTADRTLSVKDFAFSFDAVISGVQISKGETAPVTQFLSGAGFAGGYKHLKMAPDSSAFSDWGLNVAVLTNIKLDDVVQTQLEVALLANVYQFTFGPAYLFGEKKFAFLTGVTLKF